MEEEEEELIKTTDSDITAENVYLQKIHSLVQHTGMLPVNLTILIYIYDKLL